MLTKTQLKILAYLIDNSENPVGIRELAREIKSVYYLVHKNVQQLKERKIISLRKAGKTSLVNFHPQVDATYLIEAEGYKRRILYQKYPSVRIMVKKIIEQAKSSFFVLLIFGSYTTKPRHDSDLDLLVVVPSQKQVDVMERVISSVAMTSIIEVDATVVTEKSFQSMLTKKGLNVVNQARRKHILVYGSQLYYKILENE